VSTYGAILKVSLSERFVYRGSFFIGTFFRFLPIITSVFLWSAVFAGSGKDVIAGYSYPDMIGYFVLVMIARAFSSMPDLSRTVALDIRDGLLNKFLLKPVDYITWMLMTRVAHKLVYYVMAFGPFAILIGWLRYHGYFPGWPGTGVFLAFLASLAMGFLIGYLLNVLIGLVAFWLLEITSFLFLMTMLEYFFSGHMIPLDLLPDALRRLCHLLPFQFEAYVPVAIFLGRIPHHQLGVSLLVQGAWVLLLWGACRIVFLMGVRRYTAVGG
jgi:ABC-2 type transport system permease protein